MNTPGSLTAGPCRVWRRFRRGSLRHGLRLCAVGSALVYLIVALGIPLPLSLSRATAEKDLSEPFPCMESACGCCTARDCWLHCCCHTMAERLQWAHEHHVRPPDYALAAARAQGLEWSDDAEAGECGHQKCNRSGGCCSPSPRPSPFKGEGEKCCCCHCSAPHATKTNPVAKSRGTSIVLIKALACQGFGTNWLAAGASLPPPATVTWSMAHGLTGRVEPMAENFSSFLSPPPIPPPRFVAG